MTSDISYIDIITWADFNNLIRFLIRNLIRMFPAKECQNMVKVYGTIIRIIGP